jgi:penicillin-binding protein 1A
MKEKVKRTKSQTAWVAFKTLCKAGLITGMILLCIVTGLLIGVVAGCIITTDSLQDEDLYITGFVTFIYDGNDNIIGTLKGSENKNRVWADYEEIPQDLLDAVVSIEDERFYEHNGVDYKRTAAAFLGYFLPGFSSHGGSTITQQVVKNITGDDARSIPRKIREQWRALQLEDDHSKTEILELYCNVIFMANDVYGVKTAASAYFNKDLSQLNLAECAFLAGITNSPSKYNPLTTSGRANAYKRQVIILDKMRELGYIDEAEYMTAIQTELTFNEDYKKQSANTNQTSTVNSYFMEAVVRDLRSDLMTTKGYTEAQANNIIYNSGISIKTTMNPEIQKIVDEEFCNIENFSVNKNKGAGDNPAQASITVTDPYTGHVLAMYGGYGEKTANWGFNRAREAQRQPGSSIKPILVYGPLMDMGLISPDTVVEDQVVYLNPQTPDVPWPKNSGGYTYGATSVRQAVYRSQNIVTAILYDQFSDRRSDCLNYLKQSGIDRTTETQIAACLGGFNKGMSTMEMAGAYSPFVTDGTYNPAITYTKVYDRNGDLLFENPHTSVKVYQNISTVENMTSILQGVVTEGTAAGFINVKNSAGQRITACGKTGTTTNNYDVWFVGYTPYYAAAVWYGYDNNTYINPGENKSALNLWNVVMNRIHANLTPTVFSHTTNSIAPATIAPQSSAEPEKVKVSLCSDSGMVATAHCPNTETQYFIEGTQPTAVCTLHAASDAPASATPTAAPATPTPEPPKSATPPPAATPTPTPVPSPTAEIPPVPVTPDPTPEITPESPPPATPLN